MELCDDKLSSRWFDEQFYVLRMAPGRLLIDDLFKDWCVVYGDDVLQYGMSSWTGEI